MNDAQVFFTGVGTGLFWSEIIGLFITATFFSIAAGIGAYIKGRLAGTWMIAGFFFGPIAMLVLLFQSDR